jgi:hypothetical protein
MAMYITYHRKDGRKVVKSWHINEPVPKVEGYVVTFQADGDELNFLLAAMEQLDLDKSTGRLLPVTNEWNNLP